MFQGGQPPDRPITVGVILAAVVIAVTLVSGAGAGAATTTVSVGDGVTGTNGTVELPVTLSGTPAGLAGYQVRVQLPNETTARFRDGGVDESFGFKATDVTATEIVLAAADTETAVQPNDGLVRLANLTVGGVTPGTVPVRVTVSAVDADDGDRVTPEVRNGSVTVTQATAVSVPETVRVGRIDRTAPAAERTARVVVRNPGTEPLSVTPTAVDDGLTVARPTAETVTVPAGGARVVAVTITPEEDGSVTETLRLSTDAGERAVAVKGTAVSPSVSLPSTTVELGATAVGSTGDGTITVGNAGETPLSVTATGEVRFPAGRTLTVPPDGERVLPVVVAVTDDEATASVTLQTNDPDRANRTVTVTATGITSPLSATQPTFEPTVRGETTTATVTVENNADAPTALRATAAGSAFAVVEAPETVPAGGNATVTVAFQSSTAGTATGSLRLGPERNLQLSLAGQGVGPTTTVPAGPFDAGVVRATGSETLTVPIVNTGPPGTTLRVTSATVDGPFEIVRTPETVSAGEDRPVVVRFTPSTATEATGRLRIETDTGDLIRTVAGTGARRTVETRVGNVQFGSVDTGERVARTVEIANTGGLPVNVTRVTATGPAFAVTDAPARLVAGASATVRVVATPTAAGETTGQVIVDYANTTETTVDLTATGREPAAARAADGPVSFGAVPAGSGQSRTVVVANRGSATLRLGAATTAGPFQLADDARRLLAPGEQTAYTVVYAPGPETAGTDATGTVRVPTPNDPNRTAVTAELTGTATAGETAVTPTALTVGRLPVGETATGTVTVESVGNGTTNVREVTVSGPDADRVTVDGPATPTLAPGEQATYTITVDATTRGPVTARVVVQTADGPVTATVGAVGVAPTATLSTAAISVEPTRLGDRRTERLQLSNDGNAPLNVTGVETDESAFTVVDAPETVPAGGSRPIVVRYAPAATDAAVAATTDGDPQEDAAILTVATNASDRTARLEGEAVTPDVRVDTRAVQFGTTPPGEAATRQVTVRNDRNATAAVTLTGVRLSGDADAFNTDGFAGETLAPGESITRTVTFRPTTQGRRFASLSVRNDDTRQGANVVTLSNLETTVAVQFGSVTVDYRSPSPGRQPAVDISRGVDRAVSLSTLRVGAETSEDFTVRLETATAAFGGRLDQTGEAPLRYLDATAPVVDNATVTFTVSKAALAAAGSPAETVRVLATTGEDPDPVDTAQIGETRTNYRYRATLRSLTSDYVVASGVPATSVEAVSVPERVTVGETATARVRVVNNGRAAGDRTVRLRTDGQVVRRTVSVPAGGATTATLPVSYDDTGEYQVSVAGVTDQPTVVVESRESSVDAGRVVPPEAALSAPATVAVGESVTLDASASTDNAGIVAYRWDTDGDGVVETQTGEPTLTRAFDDPGRQTVSVTTVDRADETDTASVTITITSAETATTTISTRTVTDTSAGTVTDTSTGAVTDTSTGTVTDTSTRAATPTGTVARTPTPSPTATRRTPPTQMEGVTTPATVTGTPTPQSTTATGAPGFGLGLALAAFVALAAVVARCRQ